MSPLGTNLEIEVKVQGQGQVLICDFCFFLYFLRHFERYILKNKCKMSALLKLRYATFSLIQFNGIL